MDATQPERTSCYVALGGNVGDVAETFHCALDDLAAFPETTVDTVSSFQTFPAVGNKAGDAFLNAVVELKTSLAPLELLDRLQEVETRYGRIRSIRWGPRTLDLDVILFGSSVIETPRLRVPHPAFRYRRFVLDPLFDIAADVVDPESGKTVQELLERLLRRPLPVAVYGSTTADREHLAATLTGEFDQVTISTAQTAVPFGETNPRHNTAEAAADEPVLIFCLQAASENGSGHAARSPEQSGPYDMLPVESRIDVPASDSGNANADDRLSFLRSALHAALGE